MPEADFEKELTEARRMLQEGTKGISYEDNWGRRDLAYKIKKQTRGHYVVFNFTAAPEAVAELRANIKLNPAVIRHLLTTVPEDYQPGRYKEEMLTAEKPAIKSRPKPAPVKKQEEPEQAPKPALTIKEEEEQLATVEKKLEKILENPDIDIK